ncbi:hypothetical protein [Mycobacterium sp. shizuoka-1]|uniref:hypothetical protein n=1 Tax=Mycobacterium sp. shizuoka-1 TaxID=2039281 RepID=UPI000C065B98|nr:hypothetical protein [Mycobacterium sp. shizuoka-1]GAY16232.1 hypothetical protein MSZK_29580 [Mycobacterium sp. shizuoka-1]
MAIPVSDPSLFGDRDEVEIGGRRFEVDGLPDDWRNAPAGLAQFARVHGCVIHAKRQG